MKSGLGWREIPTQTPKNLAGLGPSPGWGPVRVGALPGLGPIWAHMGPLLFKKLIILMKNHKFINKNIKVVNLGILKVKTWFGDKDLFS